jgi:penicillin-insensitive murein endopeptidase
MMARIASLFSLSVLFVAGVLVVADRVSVAQSQTASETPAATAPMPADVTSPTAPAHEAPAQTTIPATPASPAPIATTPPAPDVAPVVTAPPVTPAPVVTAPPVTPAPVVTAPPLPAPSQAVIAPPLPPAKPALQGSKAVAKYLFAAKQLPSLGKAMAIGYYPSGCLAGGVELPVNGPNWQVMRVSRNRNWGHPNLVRFLERFAPAAAKATGWKGILVGDMAQPRGGPTPFGHKSHQTGLDVDIWFMPMPDHTLSAEEREKISAINLVSDDWKGLNPKTWTPQQVAFIRTAAEQPEVERVLVNAAIKKELCRTSGKNGASWLKKVRPWYWHHDHIHVRLKCPADSPNCRGQPEVPDGDGCNDKELAHWFSDKVLKPKIVPGGKPPKPITMADLPPACQTVLSAPAPTRAAKN